MRHDNIRNANKPHPEIVRSSFLHPYIHNIDELIDWGLTKLGGGEEGLNTAELTRKMCEICVADAIEKYSKYASFPIRDQIISIEHYDKKEGIDLSEYNIADIRDISFKRDALLFGYGNDIFFGPYGMMNSYAGAGVFPFSNGLGGYNTGWVGLHNLHENLEMINRLTGSAPQWRYNWMTKRLFINPAPKLRPGHCNNVILVTYEEEPPPEMLYGNEYVKRLFLAYLKIQLGTVRKKFGNIQLLGGGTIDNTLAEEGKEELKEIMETIQRDEGEGFLCEIG